MKQEILISLIYSSPPHFSCGSLSSWKYFWCFMVDYRILPSKWWVWSLIFHGLWIGILSELLTLSFLHAAAESLQKGILIDPCTPKGYSLDGKNEYLSAIHGQGNFSECRAASLTLLQKGKGYKIVLTLLLFKSFCLRFLWSN